MAFDIVAEFTTAIRQWTRKTKANGDEMAEDIGKLLNNDVYLKKHLEELDGNAVKDGDKGVAGGVATLGADGKLAEHVEYNHVDNIPYPVWSNIIGKPSAYPPSYHTHGKLDVGLGNVDNTADANKSVKYAATAGDADTLDGKHAASFATSSHSHSNMTAASASAAGKAGLVPAPSAGAQGKYLRGDGTWQTPPDTNTTYGAATQSAAGLMSAADKKKLDGVAVGANVTPTGLMSGYVRSGQKAGTTLGDKATAEGDNCTASGINSHAEGRNCRATGNYSHAEGQNCEASGQYSHAEGETTIASKSFSHAEGSSTRSSGGYGSHAEGNVTTASGSGSHAEGENTVASGDFSHAGGVNTIAAGYAQTAIGYYNTERRDSYFIVGNGSGSIRSNAFRIYDDGTPYGKKAYNTSGADYAEFFEWLDGNPEAEDRRGYFVTMDGDKIRIANSKDDYILGVISGRPSVIGNSDPDDWHGHFLTDEFGDFIMEKTIEKRKTYREEEVEETYLDEDGTEKVRLVPRIIEDEIEVEVDSYVLNPDYDQDKPYVPRAERKEWAAVGMLGVLLVRDDGTCQVNGYCKVADGGIATASETGWRVIARVNEHLVKIVYP